MCQFRYHKYQCGHTHLAKVTTCDKSKPRCCTTSTKRMHGRCPTYCGRKNPFIAKWYGSGIGWYV
jgi:hypothetical protein